MSSESRVAPPDLPRDRLADDGWSLVEDEVETLFSLPTARVEGRTQVYEDTRLREAVRGTTGFDQMWRFFFATQVSFTPSLAPGIAPLVRPKVVREARSSFAENLVERGFEKVKQGDTRQARVRSGATAEFTPFKALFRLPEDAGADLGGETLEMEGFLAVWRDDGFVVAGGAYPAGLADLVDGEVSADEDYRHDLLDLIRSVR
jgi:hypothetical protein